MYHSKIHVGCSYGYYIDFFLRIGPVTMTAFFILSGYVNRYSYKDIDLIDGKYIVQYYKNRAISILPTYYLVVIIYNLLISKEGFINQLLLFPTEALCIQSIFSSLFSFGHNSGTWFVSCIMLCYLMYPLLSILVNCLSVQARAIVLFCLIVLLLYIPFVKISYGLASNYTNPIIRFFEFSIGVILATLDIRNWSKKKWRMYGSLICIIWIIASIVLFYYLKIDVKIDDYTVYSVFFLPLWILAILCFKEIKIKTLMKKRIISFFSGITYSMFMVQFFIWPIVLQLNTVITLSNTMIITIVFALCILLSSFIHYAFENPTKKLLKRVFLKKERVEV